MSRIQIIALLCCAMLLAAPTLGRPQVEGIHVSGRGEVLVIPDMARVTLRVTRDGQDAVALKKELDDVTRKVLSLTHGPFITFLPVQRVVMSIKAGCDSCSTTRRLELRWRGRLATSSVSPAPRIE